jgi:hypothetical protein
MEVIGRILGLEVWNPPCTGEQQPSIGGEPPEVGEALATAEISAGKSVCSYQQAIRMDPEDDDTDNSDWEDPPPLFGRDPVTAKVVDVRGNHPERKVVGTGAMNQDKVS